jgi:hypothetical protein
MLDGAQSGSGIYGRNTNLFSLPGIKPDSFVIIHVNSEGPRRKTGTTSELNSFINRYQKKGIVIVGDPGLESRQEKGIFSVIQDFGAHPVSYLVGTGILPWESSGWGVRLTTYSI